MSTNYIISGWCYAISALLDAIDGHAARHFNQSKNLKIYILFHCLFYKHFTIGTRFGAMLDQLTDRCGTMGLMVTLSYFYPSYMFLFQISMAIDIACHWLYMQTYVFY